MIASTIIALREGIEIALVLGILVAYLRKIQQQALMRSVYLGLSCAVVASVGGAALLQRLSIDQESLEGFFMLAAAAFVISMVIWMAVTAKKIRTGIEDKINTIVATPAAWKAHLGVFGFTFLMVVREGIETAIFLQAVALSAGAWQSAAGTAVGVTLASAFAVVFIRGSLRIDIVRFLKVTAFTLIIFSLQLVVNAVHEFYEYGILPANPKMMEILGPVVQNNMLFIAAIISIPAFMLIIPSRKNMEGPTAVTQRRWQLSAGIASIAVILFLGVGDIFSSSRETDLSAESIVPQQDGIIKIPVSKVEDGGIHRFAIRVDSIEIRFFVLRTNFGKIATAFDACRACYSYGHYYMKNGELICSVCEAPSPLSKLRPSADQGSSDPDNSGSMEGNGCAPIYLPSHLLDGSVVISMNDLQEKRKYFDITPENK